MSKIKFTDTAREDLREIAFYIAESSGNSEIAVQFISELREKTKLLESFPESGSIPRDRVLKSCGYRYLSHKEYLIFYHYDSKEDISHILSVFNAKKDYMRVMKKFI